jgi:catechol 2,3-dioxygenase-like lactoylglutathione lyase family enzyme
VAKVLSKMAAAQFMAGVLFCGMVLSQPGVSQTGNTQAGPLTGLMPDHVTISVEDLDRESEWYVRVLGFKVAPHTDTDPDFLNWHLTIPGYRVDLIKYKGSVRPASTNPLYLHQGWIHIAFNVPDLAAAFKELQALHTDATAANKDANGLPTRVVMHDPEGNEVEMFKRP